MMEIFMASITMLPAFFTVLSASITMLQDFVMIPTFFMFSPVFIIRALITFDLCRIDGMIGKFTFNLCSLDFFNFLFFFLRRTFLIGLDDVFFLDSQTHAFLIGLSGFTDLTQWYPKPTPNDLGFLNFLLDRIASFIYYLIIYMSPVNDKVKKIKLRLVFIIASQLFPSIMHVFAFKHKSNNSVLLVLRLFLRNGYSSSPDR
jgi:hypothetical protein